MNFFSSLPFLEALAESFFEGRSGSIGLFRVEGEVYRLLVVDGRPITRFSFIDVLEPVEEVPPGAEVAALGYLPRVVRGIGTAEAWRRAAVPGRAAVCPLVAWDRYASWDAFEAALKPHLRAETRRRRRVLERTLGPIEYAPHDPDPGTLATCIRWKSAQYRATGLRDVFRDPRHARFYGSLLRRGVLAVSALRAGGRLVAVQVGVRDGARRRAWMPAYDADFAAVAPGRQLLLADLEHSCRAGDREFDFLLGAEPYKFDYATHVRLCGPAGREPRLAWAERQARRGLKRVLRGMPGLRAWLRGVREDVADR